MKRKHSHRPHNRRDIKPLVDEHNTVTTKPATTDVRYYPDVLVQQLNNQISDLKEQLQHQKRCNELLDDLVHADTTVDIKNDIVSNISKEYILQPAPRGYVMIDITDLSGRAQFTTIVSCIKNIYEIHPDLDIEEITRSICKQLTHNDGAVYNEFYIIRA